MEEKNPNQQIIKKTRREGIRTHREQPRSTEERMWRSCQKQSEDVKATLARVSCC